MIASKTQVFTYRNEFGERLQLVVDLESESAVLSSADFEDVEIKHDRFLNSGLILGSDESDWIAARLEATVPSRTPQASFQPVRRRAQAGVRIPHPPRNGNGMFG